MNVNTPAAPHDLAAIIHGGGTSRHLGRRWVIVASVVAVAIVAVIAGISRGSKTLDPQYVLALVERGGLSLTVTATGNLEPTNKVTVGSELSGTALEVLVDTNDRVTKGQPLAKLDTRKLSQQTAGSRAALASAKAKVSQAQATEVEKASALSRAEELKKLSDGKAPSKADMDTAIAAADRARADLLSAEAAVKAKSAAPKKSFLQSIVPSPPSVAKKAEADGGPTAPKKAAGAGRIWVLRNGQPEALNVKTGITKVED